MHFVRLVVALGLACSPLAAQTPIPSPQTPSPEIPSLQNPPIRVAPPAPSTLPPVDAAPPIETALPGLEGDKAFAGEENADPTTSVILENADSFEQIEAGKFTVRGNVRIRYKNYVLTSDRADVDTKRGEAYFTGNVKLVAPSGATVNGGPNGAVRINLRRSTYTLEDARTTIAPEALQAGVILPVFVYGGTISGRPGFIDARGGRFTTCDFLEPHYTIGARQLYVIPGKRLVARRATFYRKGRPVITIPYFIVPLDRRFARQTLTPEVGQSPDEGFYAKFAIGYALASSLPGILRLDALQKKGLGTGFEQNYGDTSRPTRGSGLFSAYHLADRSTGSDNLSGSLSHAQRFGTVAASLNTQFQQNSYLQGASRSRAMNAALNFARNVGNLDLGLRTNLARNDYGLGSSQTLTSSLDSSFRPTDRARLETKLDFSQFSSPGSIFSTGTNHKQLDSNLDYAQRGRLYDLEVLTNKFSRLSGSDPGGGTFFGGLERLPEFRLATDAERQSGLRHFLPGGAQMNLSLGAFNEPSSQIREQRARFGLDLGTNTRRLDSRQSLDYGGAFQQGFYGDNTAQYVLDGRAGYRLRLGRASETGVTYTYLRPYGFTPFQFDVVGSTNVAALNFNYQETRRFRLNLATGYDFNRARSSGGFEAAPWQNLYGQMLIYPGEIFRLRTTASYDINHSRLLDLTNNLRVRARNGFALDLAARFAPDQHKFSQINGQFDLPFLRDPREDAGYRLRAIGGYNGFTKKFEYKGLALTRSWHDYDLSLIYQDNPMGLRPGSTFTLNFRLKAFPAAEPFAVGQFGQSLDSGIGDAF